MSDVPAEAVRAAQEAVTAWLMGAQGRGGNKALARAAVTAAEPFIRADEWERVAQFLARVADERDPCQPSQLQEMGAAALKAAAGLIREQP